MHGKVWTFARLAIPIDFRLILWGVIMGILAALISLLTESAELATGRGIAVAVSASIGCWLGVKLSLLTSQVFMLWMVGVMKRVEVLESRLPSDAEDEGMPVKTDKAATGTAIEGFLLGLFPLGFALAIISTILAVIDLQVDIGYGAAAYITPFCVGLGYALLMLARLSFCMWQITRHLAHLESRMDSGESVLSITQQTHRFELAISKAGAIVCKLTGVGCPASDYTAA